MISKTTSPLGSFILAFALLGGLAACELEPLDPMDNGPLLDDDDEGVVCAAELMISGSLIPPGVAPGEEEGCKPVGTWTFNVSMLDPGDCDSVPYEASYVYIVTDNPDGGYLIDYPADPDNLDIAMKITGEGPGDCHGNFEHYTPDGKGLLLLKPWERDLVIQGSAFYELTETSQL